MIRLKKREILLLGLGLTSIHAEENFVHAIGNSFPSSSPLLILGAGIVLLTLIGAIIAWEIFKSDQWKKEKYQQSLIEFESRAKKKGLTPQEQNLLKNVLNSNGTPKPEVVFTAPAIYDQAVFHFVRNWKRSQGRPPYDALKVLREKLEFVRLPVETPLTSSRQLRSSWNVTILREEARSIPCRIESVTEHSWALQCLDDEIHTLREGQEVTVWFIRSGDAEYRIRAVISTIQGVYIQLQHSLTFKRSQLRKWVRTDVSLPCKVHLSNSSRPTSTNSLEGKILDISGGGMRIRLAEGLASGTYITLGFQLSKQEIKGLQGKVLGNTRTETTSPMPFVHRIQFDTIEPATQEKIVRYVFAKSRKDAQFR